MNNWITVSEASHYTGLCEKRIIELFNTGVIQAIHVGCRVRCCRQDLDAIIFRKAHERVQSRGVHHTLKLKNSII